jgi:large subunit ribosomal protein L29
MTIMRVKQMREAAPKELDSRLSELRLELMKESGSVKMGKPIKNTGRIGEIKRTVARILTVKNELRRKQAQVKAAPKPEAKKTKGATKK